MDKQSGRARGIVAPIQLSTTFERGVDGTYPDGFSYTRANNPNREALEADLRALEGGQMAACFASGTAATMAVFQALSAGDHVLVAQESYYNTQLMLREIFSRWGLTYAFIDMTDPQAVQAALKPNTKMLWLETPSNPRLRLTDLATTAALARSHGAVSVCDNTIGTPVLQQPLALGCDLVVHSTTKYINGHSDVLGGVVVAREDGELAKRLRTIQVHGGAVPSPFDCWLVSRGLHTMRHRIMAQCATAQKVAEFLAGHASIKAVHYPGLPSHPHHQLAKKQMTRFGGLLSFEIHGGQEAAFKMIGKLAVFQRATSLGGVESLIEHRASMEGPQTMTPPGLVRMSVGLEEDAELLDDLRQALA